MEDSTIIVKAVVAKVAMKDGTGQLLKAVVEVVIVSARGSCNVIVQVSVGEGSSVINHCTQIQCLCSWQMVIYKI